MTTLGIFGLAWCGLSLLFLYRACAFAWSQRHIDRSGVATSGKVVGEERRTRTTNRSTSMLGTGGRRSVSYSFPVIAFRTTDGRELRASPTVNVAHAYPVGATVDIRYLPADPTRIRVVDDSVARVGPGLAVGVGAVFVLIGLGILSAAYLMDA